MAKRYDNWYVSKVDVGLNAEGRIETVERVLTAPEASKSKKEGRRLAAMTMARMTALGIENLHLNPPDHKKYSKLLREQNKRRNCASNGCLHPQQQGISFSCFIFKYHAISHRCRDS